MHAQRCDSGEMLNHSRTMRENQEFSYVAIVQWQRSLIINVLRTLWINRFPPVCEEQQSRVLSYVIRTSVETSLQILYIPSPGQKPDEQQLRNRVRYWTCTPPNAKPNFSVQEYKPNRYYPYI